MKVYLVGAGPGDPKLITVRGKELLERADVVLYDRLAHPALLTLAPLKAERIYVGKKASSHEMPQAEIAALMIAKAQEGKQVVRLKGGDPLLFGRASEELTALADAGVDFEIVPGVTSASGLAAYAGIPITDRDFVSAVTFVSGHDPAAIDWRPTRATLVIFMGATQFGEIARRMIESGWPPSTPAMGVRWATRTSQHSVVGTLETLFAQLAPLKPPIIIVVGQVVTLSGRFNWFEKLPLFGKRVVITREQLQAPQFSAQLRELGAEVVECPVIEIRPIPGPPPAGLCEYDWVIFTSVNGVRHFVDRLDDIRELKGKIAAVGASTKAALEALHLKVDLVPADYVAEGIVAAFANEDLLGKRILLPRASVARDLVPDELAKRGACVDVLDVYRTVVPENAPGYAEQAFSGREKPNWVTFTSSSTVKNLLAIVDRQKLDGVRIASIGPVTSATIEKHGLHVDCEANPHTMNGLLSALLDADQRRLRK